MKKRILILPLLVTLLSGCNININNNKDDDPIEEIVEVESVSLNATEISLTVGETYKLIATIKPSDANNKNLTWTSEDSSVATVSKTGLVTAKNEGYTTINVTTKDGGYVDSCDVYVSEKVTPDPGPTPTTQDITIDTKDFEFSSGSSIDNITKTVEGFSFVANKNSGTTNPAYYLDSKVGSVRLYPNNTWTISSTNGNITKIVFTYESHNVDSLAWTANPGTISADTWNGNSSSITFTVPDAKEGKKSIRSLVITYASGGSGHEPLDLGNKSIKEVKDYITNPTHEIKTNSHNCGVDEGTTVTIKGYAMAKISLIKTAKAFGLNVSEPNKIIIGDNTDAIAVATKTGEGTLFKKVDNHQMKSNSRYTITGYVSIYLGQPELVVESFNYDETLDVSLNIDAISKANITIPEFYTKATNVNYNCAGHGYGETYTLKGLTCFYVESDGSGIRYYNFTDGTNNIRVNAFNIDNATVGRTYDVTGIISLLNLSPIIVAFKIANSTANPVDLTTFYTSANEQSISSLRLIKGSQNDTDAKYPAVINSYETINKVSGYLCVVEENYKLYVGVSDTYLGEKILTCGKDRAKAEKGVALIKNDNFWNTTEDRLMRYNPYYEDYLCENAKVDLYYVNRQMGYSNNEVMWEILLIPQSIPEIN